MYKSCMVWLKTPLDSITKLTCTKCVRTTGRCGDSCFCSVWLLYSSEVALLFITTHGEVIWLTKGMCLCVCVCWLACSGCQSVALWQCPPFATAALNDAAAVNTPSPMKRADRLGHVISLHSSLNTGPCSFRPCGAPSVRLPSLLYTFH